MALFPERGPSVKEIVKERPEEVNLPESLGEIKKVETAFKANVQDGGKQLIQSPANQVVTVTIPGTQKGLAAWSKGSITDSITWLARFWLRVAQKALFLGRSVVWGGNNASR